MLSGCATHAPWSMSEGQHGQHFERSVTLTVRGDFLLFLPAGFQPHGDRRYPLLIFLHGSGESGHELAALKLQGPPKMVENNKDFPFILVSPQSPESRQGFDPTVLNAMLDELIERLPIDTDRVYLTGLSMGGEWSYACASMNPDRFAAIAPVSGAWNPAVACQLKRIPVWAFHGAKDDVIPVSDDQAMIDAINQCGGQAKLTTYPDIGHGVWTPAYADPELSRWLLARQRNPAPK